MSTNRLRDFAREILLLAAFAIVVYGFCLPWLVVDTALLAETLLGLPESGRIEGWRLPGYAHEVETAWVVEIVRVFDDDEPGAVRVWLVWLSPISALLAWTALRRRRIAGLLGAAILQGSVGLLLLARLLEGLRHHGNLALDLGFGPGLGVAILGHAALFLLALHGLGARTRSRDRAGRRASR